MLLAKANPVLESQRGTNSLASGLCILDQYARQKGCECLDASTAKNGALICEGNESEGVAVPLKADSVVLHHGATVHYSRGNSTKGPRRAMIVNLRPRKMIDFERARGFDHTGENKVRNNA